MYTQRLDSYTTQMRGAMIRSSISASHRGFRALLSISLMAFVLAGCTVSNHQRSTSERYVSPQIEGAESRINLEEVEKAFFNTKANDLNSWMGAFEKRVNEIYEGTEVVSIDATRETGKLNVTGFVEKNKQPGFQTGEDKLFALQQTGNVVDNKMPYQVTDQNGQPYNQGHYSLFDNPIIQGLVIGNLLSSAFGPRYYTPFATTTILRDHRNGFRNTPAFNSQRTANQQFGTRYKQRATGSGIGSNTGFGRSYGTDSGARRTFGQPSGSSVRTSPWGGRRSTGFGGRGFGGRRR